MGNFQFMRADFNEPRDLMEPMILKTNNVVRFSKYKSGVQYVQKVNFKAVRII